MNVGQEKILNALRAMQWEEAKGKIQAILASFYDEDFESSDATFEDLLSIAENFFREFGEKAGLE